MTMDLHSPQVQGFFKHPHRSPADARPLLCEYVKRMGFVDEDMVVVSPDARLCQRRPRQYADYLGVPVAIGDKTRTAS